MIRATKEVVRCAIYTRKSTEDGLEQDFNSLDAQREAALSYINSQKQVGWRCIGDSYDDGGFTGGNIDRPAFQRMMQDVEDGLIDCIIVYKIDRLSRSLLDFVKIMEVLDANNVSLVSVTQQFNTTSSMGRLTLNILLSFAQFEREIISERTRDKIAAARRKGKWAGGHRVLGYDLKERIGSKYLAVNSREADQVKQIFEIYVHTGSIMDTLRSLREKGITTKKYHTKKGKLRGGANFDTGTLRTLLTNVTYLGKVKYKDQVYEGEHEAIIDEDTFGLTQGLLKQNRSSGARYRSQKNPALLNGLLRCQHCGCAMTHHYSSKPNKRYRYYVCLKAQKQGWSTCPGPSLPAPELERFVVDQIRAIGQDTGVLRDCVQSALAKMQGEIESLKKERGKKERRIRQLSKQTGKAAGRARQDEAVAQKMQSYEQQMKQHQDEVTKINTQIAAREKQMLNSDELVGSIETFDPMWNALGPQEKAKLMNLLVKQISWDSGQDKIHITFHQANIEALTQAGVN